MIHSEKITLPGGARLYPCVQTWAPFPGVNVRRSAVILCPGGGYRMLSRTEGEAMAPAFASLGCDCFVLHYRTGERAVWPNPLIDLAQAVAYVRAHADAWCIDPDKIAVCGFSAGGHLCAMLGTRWHEPEVERLVGLRAEQIRPNALILGYPALNLRIAGSSEIGALLAGGRDLAAALDETDALRFVTSQTPPTFLWSIFEDGAVPVELGLRFCSELAAHEVPFELHTFQSGEHACALGTGATAFGGTEYPHLAHWFELCGEWLRAQFGAPSLVGELPAMPPMGGNGRAHLSE